MNTGDYLAKVVNHFLTHRRGPLWISARDLIVFLGWESEAIPLHIVLSAITATFEGMRAPDGLPGSNIRHAEYCDAAVRAEWRAYRKRQVGEPPAIQAETTEPDTRRETESVLDFAATLNQVLVDILGDFTDDLQEPLRGRVTELLQVKIKKLQDEIEQGRIDDIDSVLELLRKIDRAAVGLLQRGVNPALTAPCMEAAKKVLREYGVIELDRIGSSTLQAAFEGMLRKKFGLSKLESYAIFYR